MMNRRRFLMASAQIAFGLLLAAAPINCIAKSIDFHPMSFYHTHTGEKLEINYSPKMGCSESTHHMLNEFLRDFRTEQVHSIDTDLLGILSQIKLISGSSGVFEIISGYRSPETNRMLSLSSPGVAQHSLHMKGQAVDIRMTDVPIWKIRQIATILRTGGVGYYVKSDFIHLDTGEFRTWSS